MLRNPNGFTHPLKTSKNSTALSGKFIIAKSNPTPFFCAGAERRRCEVK